ncbi:M13 family metallopeptidase [Chitinophaga pendula]|uniref:M13 family metallopeptidase n=1 Tax=Chitinophaga TaxID=79328 RepID=UPI000BAF20C3|nr:MULTISPECIES: M13 family metallopeptidase [Chitinophaga]ASZ12342.1 metalloendopeptidase [Chitinophaga sp. MD30]UCJ10064.1 M13 family metallopeptidase [Chitinophaga pendula]
MKWNLLPVLGAASITLMLSCNQQGEHKTASPDMLAANLDTTVAPGDDFFSYANGGWIKKNPIPDEYSSWGIGQLVQEELYTRLLTINEHAVKDPKDPVAKKIAAFWKSGMDSATQQRDGMKPLTEDLSAIDAATTLPQIIDLMGRNYVQNSVFFGAYIGQDSKNSEQMAYHLYQGGLGLPDRDYYFNTDARTRKIREAYPGHIARMLQFAGLDTAAATKAATDIIKLETKLAQVSRKLEALRDPEANYNKMSVDGLSKLSATINWATFLQQQGVSKIDSVIVGQPEFFTALNKVLTSESIATLKLYMKWNLISANANVLGDTIALESFRFYGQLLRGSKVRQPRWKRVLNAEEGVMGEALGQLFVKEYFNEKAKQRYIKLVDAIREALKNRITKLTWMGDSTREKALHKLSTMTAKVGYPDKWKDFSSMDIKEQSYYANMKEANRWWHQYEVNKLGKPVDRTEWEMTPQTYNAYYNPSNNEIVLPAGIFTVPGKRDEELDDALVYGYAGASTIGHEITHGFDDSGRQFDAQGNLKSWWTKQDEQRFNDRAAVMVKQFDGYRVVDSLHINGKATLGENIADLGGILLGWDAFVLTEQYKKNENISGLNPGQRYFLGYALGWLSHTRDESLAQRVMTDVHSPAKFRVNGPFSDVDAFYQVWGIKPGQPMYIADSARVRIW